MLFITLLFSVLLSACSSNGSTVSDPPEERDATNDFANTTPTYISKEEADKRKLNSDDDSQEVDNEELNLKLDEMEDALKNNDFAKVVDMYKNETILKNNKEADAMYHYKNYLESD